MYPLGMDEKRTMTFNMTASEMEALENLATKKDMTKTALLRQALRLYIMVDERLSKGHKLFLEDEKAKKKAELMVI
jgi:predicted transcriptional regulator